MKPILRTLLCAAFLAGSIQFANATPIGEGEDRGKGHKIAQKVRVDAKTKGNHQEYEEAVSFWVVLFKMLPFAYA
jgi:hypothetical protein